MKEITNVTIVSTNLNRRLLENYKDYYVIENNFSYDELLQKKKVLFFNILNNLSDEKLHKLFEYLKDNNILFINITNDIELSLYTDYLMVYDDSKILIEGQTLEVLKNEKLLKRIGLNLPFMVELSFLLKDYDLINEIHLNKESLVDELWK
ncbi:MAG: hypothetical protein E7161_03050 [Firmicutes bacterium]|nr:hypothetical protein [Bacillota bacterium]